MAIAKRKLEARAMRACVNDLSVNKARTYRVSSSAANAVFSYPRRAATWLAEDVEEAKGAERGSALRRARAIARD